MPQPGAVSRHPLQELNQARQKCGCIQEWIINIAGLHLGNQTREAIYTILPFYGMVTCKLPSLSTSILEA
jgi:hypothetical protein